MIKDLRDRPCISCHKDMRFLGPSKAVRGRYDITPYERGWWRCSNSECPEVWNAQGFYVGEYKNGERWEP